MITAITSLEALDSVVDDIESAHDDEAEALRTVVVITPESVPDVELSGRAETDDRQDGTVSSGRLSSHRRSVLRCNLN